MSINKTIWQINKWSDMLIKSGQADKIFQIDGIQVEKRKVALGEYGLFILGINFDIDKETEKKLIDECNKENCLFIQIETLDYNENIYLQNLGVFKEGYYKKFITPYTAIINLEDSEEDILANMKPKGRYNIKLASKKGLEVKEVEKTDENIKLYHDLMLETTSRDGFSGNTFDYYKTFLNSLENSSLLLAYLEDKVIAGGIFTFDKEVSIYYYGASTSDKKYRNLMAPYLLQWTAIQKAKNIGSKIYDFLGIAGPNDKDSELAGVTDFKLKLTKDSKEISKSYIHINKKLKYFIIQILKKIKNGN